MQRRRDCVRRLFLFQVSYRYLTLQKHPALKSEVPVLLPAYKVSSETAPDGVLEVNPCVGNPWRFTHPCCGQDGTSQGCVRDMHSSTPDDDDDDDDAGERPTRRRRVA